MGNTPPIKWSHQILRVVILNRACPVSAKRHEGIILGLSDPTLFEKLGELARKLNRDIVALVSSRVSDEGHNRPTPFSLVGSKLAQLIRAATTVWVTIPTTVALSIMLTSGLSAAVSTQVALTSMGTFIAFGFSLGAHITLQAGLIPTTKAAYLETVLKETLLTAGALNGLLPDVHCDSLWISVYHISCFL